MRVVFDEWRAGFVAFRASAMRATAIALLAVTLTACGGGGGGSGGSAGGGSGGSGGGGGGGPSLSVDTTRLEVTADAGRSYTPTASLAITVHNPSQGATYVGAAATDHAITGMTLSANGNQILLTISFKDPSSLGPGSYSDTIRVAICSDNACTQIKSGTERTVDVVYRVAVVATVSLSADPATVGAGLPTTLIWNSTNASSCTAAGEWTGTFPGSGSQVVIPTGVGDHTYTLTCSGPGDPATASVSVTAVGPTATLSAFPRSVVAGKSVTLRWQGQYVASCVASGAWSGSLPPAGFRTVTPGSPGAADFHLTCSNAAASATADASVTVTAAPGAPPATTYRMNESHDGVLITTNGASYPTESAPTWSVDLGAPVSYPLIANGLVFVVTAKPDGSYGNRLFALNAQTGAVVWGPIAIAGTYFGSGLTYANGRVFVLMFNGALNAFNAVNGAPLWSVQLPGYWYKGMPNAYGGTVFVAGSSDLTAVDETSGAIRWTTATGATTDWVSPAVSSEGVYVQSGNCSAGAVDPVGGSDSWQARSPCDSPWGYTPVIKGGIFIGRTGHSLNLFDATTGGYLAQLASDVAPAVTATAVITLSSGTLASTRSSDRVQTWTFSGDGTLITAPVVVNHTVFVGASSGKVYGVDTETGLQVWMGVAPMPIGADNENGGPMPPSGPAAGENLLIFPTGNALVAWRLL